MGYRIIMAKKKVIIDLPKEPKKRQPGYYELYLGSKLVGTNLTAEDFCSKYFINLDKNLNKDTNLEALLDKYESIWKSGGTARYIDSWGHKWNQGVTRPKLLEYLKSKQNNLIDKIE